MQEEPNGYDVKSHFDGKAEVVRQTYDELLKVLRKRYLITESPKKKSIHLMNATTFGGVTTPKLFDLDDQERLHAYKS